MAWRIGFCSDLFGNELRKFIEGMEKVTVKAAGIEASAERKKEFVKAAEAALQEKASSEAQAKDARATAEAVSRIATPSMIRRAERAAVLWVDDQPNNNGNERQALAALGIRFVLATSTDQALDMIKRGWFDAIISDMGRPPDQQAGYTLLDRLRADGDQTPFIIYSGSRAPEHFAEAKRRGAVGCTNRPDELFEMVFSVLT
jgi:CheY-like chemotaxis protein